MQLAAISWISWIFNNTFDMCKRGRRTYNDVYTVLTATPNWFINPSGQFVDAAVFGLANVADLWLYESGELKLGFVEGRPKKFPLLSCEMKYDDQVISLDSFLEDTKFISNTTPSLPVLMAAFQIYNKKVVPWWKAKFSGITRMGSEVAFDGSTVEIPSE
jgi:hypothetical protein